MGDCNPEKTEGELKAPSEGGANSSINQLSQDPKSFCIAPDLAGFICRFNNTVKTVASPCFALLAIGLSRYFPCAATQLSATKFLVATVDPDCQQNVSVVTNKSIEVAEFASGPAGKAVAVGYMGKMGQLSRPTAKRASASCIFELGDGHELSRWVYAGPPLLSSYCSA